MSGTVSQYAASFGNSWKVPDQQNEVLHWIHWMSISLFLQNYSFLLLLLFFLMRHTWNSCALWKHTESNPIVLMPLIWSKRSEMNAEVWFYCIWNKWQSAFMRCNPSNWVSLCPMFPSGLQRCGWARPQLWCLRRPCPAQTGRVSVSPTAGKPLQTLPPPGQTPLICITVIWHYH